MLLLLLFLLGLLILYLLEIRKFDILCSDEPGFASWRHLNKKYGIPAVDLSRLAQDELRERLLKKEPVFISFSKEDEKNQWYDALKSGVMIWFSVSLSIIAATNIVLSLWRLINYIRKYGVSYSLSQTIMGICLASNIINLINVSIDPIYSRNIFGFMVSSLLLTLTYPVTLITTLLITLYWHEIMTINSAKVYINLKRKVFIIPLITVSVILFFLQIGGSISRGLRFNANTLISVNAICFIIFLTTINSYCLVIGCLIKKKIKKSAGVSRKSNRRSKLLHVTNYIMISSLSTFLALPFFVIIITNIFRIPYMFIVTLYFIYFFLFISDTIKILAFGLPTTSITSTKRSSKSEDVSSQLNRSNTS